MPLINVVTFFSACAGVRAWQAACLDARRESGEPMYAGIAIAFKGAAAGASLPGIRVMHPCKC